MKSNPIAVLVSASAVAVIAALGCGGNGGISPLYSQSVSRLKILNTSLLMYVNDYDDVLPLAVSWMDGLGPYAQQDSAFHSPMVGAAGFGYAFNSALAGKGYNTFSNRDTIVSIFDSTDLSRNATQPTSSMPTPPRYGSKNTVGYLDGHVTDEPPPVIVPPDPYQTSRTRLKQASIGMMIYATDYDDALPLANTWMDRLVPYGVVDNAFHSPKIQSANPTNYGYAFNSALAGVSLPSLESPSSMVMLFDSTVLTRNATASTTTFPSPPRYSGKNTYSYADGSVP